MLHARDEEEAIEVIKVRERKGGRNEIIKP